MVVGQCRPRHRHQEWRKFPRRIDAETPKHRDPHLIVDNQATHKHPKVQAWLKRHPRVHMHFTPTSASWCNADPLGTPASSCNLTLKQSASILII